MIGTIREKALKIKTVSKLNTEKSHHTRPVLIFMMSPGTASEQLPNWKFR